MQGKLTGTAGGSLFCIFAIVLSIPGISGLVRLLLLVAARVVLGYLHCRQLPVVYRFHRILEAPGGRPELPLADKGRLRCSNQETGVYC